MKIINAFWEKRNLNLNTYELEFEDGDKVENILDEIKRLNDPGYLVAKVPAGRNEINNCLIQNGFYYAESIIKLGMALKDYNLPKKLEKINNSISYKLVEGDKIFFICSKIQENIFTTDRIALDKLFGLVIANKRYSNWIIDEFNKDSSNIFELYYFDRGIGFFGIKEINENNVEIFLAGMYNEFKDLGFGFSMISKSIELAISKKIKNLNTYVSTNNIEVLRLYVKLGFNPLEIKSIFIKH